MLLRRLSADSLDRLEPAYQAFVRTQTVSPPPLEILFQSEHSRLAGALAQALLPDVFGELKPEVITAIAHHDYGWDASDQQQIDAIYDRAPRPFTEVSPEETLPCWIGSIAHGRRLGPLAGVLISRHCCLLGTGSGKHAEFVAEETARRREIEYALPYSPSDLDRWTAALGFCDLLSLYLCSGSQSSVTLPLAHPESDADRAEVALKWVGGRACLSKLILDPNAQFSAVGIKYSSSAVALEPLALHWTFTCAQ